MKLFYVYIGGATGSSLIELHDVRFTVGKTLQSTYDDIRRSWWGTPDSLHLDCWGELTSADGHNIVLKETPSLSEDKLYFVNLGGYDPDDFTELHKNVFVVTPRETKAQAQALKTVSEWKGRHKDYVYEVENMFCVSDLVREKSLYLHLEKTDNPTPFVFEYGYRPLGKKQAR